LLTAVYIAIEVVSALGLILLILMHSGKGGGLSDMFGGSIGSAAQGSTVVEKNLDRITIVLALVFAFTTLTLGLRLQ
jgi:preprotein translocase subunit SecG